MILMEKDSDRMTELELITLFCRKTRKTHFKLKCPPYKIDYLILKRSATLRKRKLPLLRNMKNKYVAFMRARKYIMEKATETVWYGVKMWRVEAPSGATWLLTQEEFAFISGDDFWHKLHGGDC